MGLEKIGTTIGKEIIAWTRTGGKSLLATKPVKINPAELKIAPQIESDLIQIAKNDYLANIKRLGLNEKDSKILKDMLADSSCLSPEDSNLLQQLFNRVTNRADIDLDGLRTLFTGKETKGVLGKVLYHNYALNDPSKLYTILNRLESSLQPKDLEIIKHCTEDALNCLIDKNCLGEFILPNKYIRNLSEILKKDTISIYNRNSNIIECCGKNKTYFTYDTEKGILEFFEENGTNKIIRNLNGNEAIYQINPENNKLNKLLEETIYLNDSNGKIAELIKYKKSDIDGIFNVVKKDLETGINIPLSKVTIDSAGKKIAKQNLVSPNGTKTQLLFKEMPNGSTQYRYKIIDKSNQTLFEQVRSRRVLSDSEFLHTINDKSYNVKFLGSDKIEILNTDTKQLDVIDLKNLLCNLSDKEKTEMITMLKKVPPDELLSLSRYKIEHLNYGTIENSFVSDVIPDTIYTLPHEFVFLHEFGHIKDMSETIETVNNCIKSKISNNIDFLKVFNKEKNAYINKFGLGDNRIDYFIQHGSGLGFEGEAIAEINALLSTPKSEALLGTRSYLLAENFPETIAYASKLLS